MNEYGINLDNKAVDELKGAIGGGGGSSSQVYAVAYFNLPEDPYNYPNYITFPCDDTSLETFDDLINYLFRKGFRNRYDIDPNKNLTSISLSATGEVQDFSISSGEVNSNSLFVNQIRVDAISETPYLVVEALSVDPVLIEGKNYASEDVKNFSITFIGDEE